MRWRLTYQCPKIHEVRSLLGFVDTVPGFYRILNLCSFTCLFTNVSVSLIRLVMRSVMRLSEVFVREIGGGRRERRKLICKK